MSPDLDPAVAAWLGSLHLQPNTINAYRQDLTKFVEWYGPQDLPLLEVTTDDLSRYSLHLSQRGTNPLTAHRRRASVRLFYTWLFTQGKIDANPAAGVAPPLRDVELVESLSVRDLRSLVAVADHSADRALLLVVMVLGLPIRDIAAAKVSDLVEDRGQWNLRVPSRRLAVPLPDLLAGPLREAVGERRRGPLFLNQRGNALTRSNQQLILRRLAKKANLGVEVSSNILIASMRAAVLAHVPAVTVLQGLGFSIHRNLIERARLAPEVKPHLAFAAASLFRPDADSTDALLDAADALIGNGRLPIAARVAVAGSAFERHLRLLAYAKNLLDPAEAKPTNIGMLQGLLRSDGTITNEEVQACATVQEVRDWAAHGWYEQVTEEVANRAVAIMRRITRDHPITPSGMQRMPHRDVLNPEASATGQDVGDLVEMTDHLPAPACSPPRGPSERPLGPAQLW